MRPVSRSYSPARLLALSTCWSFSLLCTLLAHDLSFWGPHVDDLLRFSLQKKKKTRSDAFLEKTNLWAHVTILTKSNFWLKQTPSSWHVEISKLIGKFLIVSENPEEGFFASFSRERNYSSLPNLSGLTPNPLWSANTDSSLATLASGWLSVWVCMQWKTMTTWAYIVKKQRRLYCSEPLVHVASKNICSEWINGLFVTVSCRLRLQVFICFTVLTVR